MVLVRCTTLAMAYLKIVDSGISEYRTTQNAKLPRSHLVHVAASEMQFVTSTHKADKSHYSICLDIEVKNQRENKI